MASAYQVGAAVLAHVVRRGQLDSALDERSFSRLIRELGGTIVSSKLEI